jgi:hypothetical protein
LTWPAGSGILPIVGAEIHSAASASKPNNQTTTMGDKSPKANQKKSSQKQAKASSSSQAKQQPSAKKP